MFTIIYLCPTVAMLPSRWYMFNSLHDFQLGHVIAFGQSYMSQSFNATVQAETFSGRMWLDNVPLVFLFSIRTIRRRYKLLVHPVCHNEKTWGLNQTSIVKQNSGCPRALRQSNWKIYLCYKPLS